MAPCQRTMRQTPQTNMYLAPQIHVHIWGHWGLFFLYIQQPTCGRVGVQMQQLCALIIMRNLQSLPHSTVLAIIYAHRQYVQQLLKFCLLRIGLKMASEAISQRLIFPGGAYLQTPLDTTCSTQTLSHHLETNSLLQPCFIHLAVLTRQLQQIATLYSEYSSNNNVYLKIS